MRFYCGEIFRRSRLISPALTSLLMACSRGRDRPIMRNSFDVSLTGSMGQKTFHDRCHAWSVSSIGPEILDESLRSLPFPIRVLSMAISKSLYKTRRCDSRTRARPAECRRKCACRHRASAGIPFRGILGPRGSGEWRWIRGI
jgi:hypothetical protein